MIYSLIKISYRHLLRQRLYSLLNLAGLTVGITCAVFLVLYIRDELSFDRYHRHADHIYRVVSHIREPDDEFTWAATQAPLASELRDNHPQIVDAIHFVPLNKAIFKNGEKQFTEERFYLVDSTVFDMFTYPLISGDAGTALREPHSIVLTEQAAVRYFDGDADVLGKSIENQQGETFKVTGVMKNVPSNSHFQFDALVSRNTRPQFNGSWGGFGVFTYILLANHVAPLDVDSIFSAIVAEKVKPVFDQYGVQVKYELQRLPDIHLHSKVSDDTSGGGDMSYVYIFGSIAVIILVIACVNYMNLATAKSTLRAKEIGIRKVMGSAQFQLVLQFLIESLMMSFLALAASLILVYLLLPYFNGLADKDLSWQAIMDGDMVVILSGIILVCGMVGGSYPALYLPRLKPVVILKGKGVPNAGGLVFRRLLIIGQLTLSTGMLIATLIAFQQLQFLRSRDLGFEKENMVVVSLTGQSQIRQSDAFKTALLTRPGISRVSKTTSVPGQEINKNLFQVEDHEGKWVERGVDFFVADEDFVATLGIEITLGRNFSSEVVGDSATAVLVNESMVSRMGWKDPIGKRFQTGGTNGIEKKVVGVFQDYHQASLYSPIEPLMIMLSHQANLVLIRIDSFTSEKVNLIEQTWNQIYPNDPLEYEFLNDALTTQYRADAKRSQIFSLFSGVTIMVTCLGLFGLAAFTTEQQRKELGIRKVVGATTLQLITRAAHEFLVLTTVAIFVAAPLTWYFVRSWLNVFAYHIDLSQQWPTFLLGGGVAIVVTWLSISFHVITASRLNPVEVFQEQ